MVTKLAGPFIDTWRFSTSPRSRLRLRPARRAALTMTLMRAECSMISAQDDLSDRSGMEMTGLEHDPEKHALGLRGSFSNKAERQRMSRRSMPRRWNPVRRQGTSVNSGIYGVSRSYGITG